MSKMLAAWLAATSVLYTVNATAQSPAQSYPNKPIRMLLPFPPGGPTDIMTRVLGQKLTERWGQAVIADYHSGANGNIATELAAKAAPDGYTLYMPSAGVVTVNPSLYKEFRVDPMKALAPISMLAKTTSVLVVHPSLNIKSVKELIQLAKAKPGQLNFASSGSGSAGHLGMERFNRQAQVDIKHIPYKGAGPAVTALIAGDVHILMAAMPALTSHISSGRAIALGIPSAEPSPLAPGLPTIAEAGGLPGFEVDNWVGLLGPAGMAGGLINRINLEVVAILRAPEVKEQLMKGGFDPVGSTPDQFRSTIEAGIKTWAGVIKEAGITVD